VVFDEPIVGNFEGRKLKIASASLEVEIFREALSKAGRSHAPYRKLEDAELLPVIRRLLDRRPTSGYRRVAASIATVEQPTSLSSTQSGLTASRQTRHAAGEAYSRSQRPQSRWQGDGHALLLRLPRVHLLV